MEGAREEAGTDRHAAHNNDAEPQSKIRGQDGKQRRLTPPERQGAHPDWPDVAAIEPGGQGVHRRAAGPEKCLHGA